MNRDRMFLHEMAHMWNGNLVSMEWFNDLWIKEGLTEWVTQLACQDLVANAPGKYPIEDRVMANFKIRGAAG